MIVRGTTPKHIFEVDRDLSDASVMFITYRQNGKNVVEKSLSDILVEPDQLTVELTQEDTLKFKGNDNDLVEIQIRVGFSDGARIASDIITTTAGRILKDGEI